MLIVAPLALSDKLKTFRKGRGDDHVSYGGSFKRAYREEMKRKVVNSLALFS